MSDSTTTPDGDYRLSLIHGTSDEIPGKLARCDDFPDPSYTDGDGHARRVGYDPVAACPAFPLMPIRPDGAKSSALLNETIEPYLHAEGIHELYLRLLERTERVCGRAPTRDILSLLWASRRGLTSRELVGLAGRRKRQVADTVAAIQNHLFLRDDVMALPKVLRQAVQEHYLASVARRRTIHLAIAEHFAEQPMMIRRIEEQPWQLHAAGSWRELLNTLIQPIFALTLVELTGTIELFRYWSTLENRVSLAMEYEPKLEAYRNDDRQCLGAATLYQLLGEFYSNRGSAEQGELLLRRALAIRSAILGNEDRRTIELSRAVSLLLRQGMISPIRKTLVGAGTPGAKISGSPSAAFPAAHRARAGSQGRQ